jgi:demethylmenaquinone methyltransferase/2-methoxy-6-polyprenyl-1,4-benzoquinol methylase
MTSSPQRRLAASSQTTHFGFSDVDLAAKQRLVDDVFHKVADRYDLMNDLMSGGLHRVWKDVLVAMVKPSAQAAFRHLDVAGGTGDVAGRVLARGGPLTEVTLLDINADMLRVGRNRMRKTSVEVKDRRTGPPIRRRLGGVRSTGTERLHFVGGNAESLPLPDNHFDSYTIAFGIRNVPRIPLALGEAYRVLKRGGHFLCLEFSAVDVPGLDRLYDALSFGVIPRLGGLVAGDPEPYTYLVESIRRFPSVEVFSEMIAEAGFRRVTATRLTGGVVTIHAAWKL